MLKYHHIPALLIETGFISNRREEMTLKSPAHQQKLADAILKGITNHLRKNPIRGTVFSQPPGVYTVRSGDNLSTIAKRFNISVTRLKQNNALSKNTVYTGQILKVPASS